MESQRQKIMEDLQVTLAYLWRRRVKILKKRKEKEQMEKSLKMKKKQSSAMQKQFKVALAGKVKQ